MSDPSYLRYWGKARPDPGVEEKSHPLAYHSLDVAAVGTALLEADARLRRWLAALLGLSEDVAVPLMQVVLALHDLGKFSTSFQAIKPDLCPTPLPPQGMPRGGLRHDAAGLFLWRKRRKDLARHLVRNGDVAGWARALTPLLGASFGHHGMPCAVERDGDVPAVFRGESLADALAFAAAAAGLFCPDGLALDGRPRSDRFKIASWVVAGFVTACDWLGSHQPTFPYRGDATNLSLAEYWLDHACPRAARALDMAGIVPAAPAPTRSFGDLFPEIERPTPLQDWTQSCPIAAGPNLFLIEELTGSGKTEAALVLAHRLVTGGHAVGLFDALPTQATANAMYDRLAPAYRRLFAAGGAPPSLVLSHAARDRHEGFRDSILPVGDADEAVELAMADGEPESASAACAAWIAEDRRRAMLADVGAGTVDQAVLAVLPVKHQALRLAGLARRVLLLDEVHAYDAYVSREIEVLLTFQAALGGSAILLSATLPVVVREKFLRAYAEGRRHAGADVADIGSLSDDYPLVTHLSDKGVRCWSPPRSSAPAGRTVPVEPTDDADRVVVEIARAAGAGASVCWVRNTVADAVEAFETLAERLPNVGLFHGRFTAADRRVIEGTVMRAFGPESGPEERAGRVLVATQVVEQSLDLDFDFMVSDLAPIDLIVQRAGRLWRHPQGDRPVDCRLLVLGPRPHPDADGDWYTRSFPKAGSVYRHHGCLWLTARELDSRRALVLPRDSRALVEAVYGKDGDADIPEGLRDRSGEAEGRGMAERSQATQNLLAPGAGYDRGEGSWEDEAEVATRLGDSETVRLACWEGGALYPWSAEAPTEADRWHPWRASEVRVPRRWIAAPAPQAPEVEAAVEAVKAEWPRFERRIVVVPLVKDEDGETWRGTAQDAYGKEVTVRYDARYGLRIGQDAM